ncbi:hypothetical protein BX666DRAFT_1902017 [Dichotomocladium elegans]|nr:hypothetical protein BX666DRAFT_1902017 [Dichotomocladium elegans]
MKKLARKYLDRSLPNSHIIPAGQEEKTSVSLRTEALSSLSETKRCTGSIIRRPVNMRTFSNPIQHDANKNTPLSGLRKRRSADDSTEATEHSHDYSFQKFPATSSSEKKIDIGRTLASKYSTSSSECNKRTSADAAAVDGLSPHVATSKIPQSYCAPRITQAPMTTIIGTSGSPTSAGAQSTSLLPTAYHMLSMSSAPEPSPSAAVINGVIGGSISVVIVLLGTFLYLCVKKRKLRRKREREGDKLSEEESGISDCKDGPKEQQWPRSFAWRCLPLFTNANTDQTSNEGTRNPCCYYELYYPPDPVYHPDYSLNPEKSASISRGAHPAPCNSMMVPHPLHTGAGCPTICISPPSPTSSDSGNMTIH